MPETVMTVRTDDEAALASLRRLRENVRDPERLARTYGGIIKILEEYHKRTWGRAADGRKLYTTPQTRNRWPDSSTLYNSGALKDSMTRSDAPGAVREITPFGIRYGTDVMYGFFVDKGTRSMRPKPFVKMNTTVIRLIRAFISKELKEGVDVWLPEGDEE